MKPIPPMLIHATRQALANYSDGIIRFTKTLERANLPAVLPSPDFA